MFVFNTIFSIYSTCKSLSQKKSVMNKPQAEGRVNHVCTVEEGSTLFTNKKNNEAQLLVYLKSFLLFIMVELDHQRSAVKTPVNKMGLDTLVV